MKKFIRLVFCFCLCLCLFCSCANDDGANIKKAAPTKDISEYQGENQVKSYENKHLSLGFNLPEGWRFYTDKEIEQIFGAVQSTISSETESSGYFVDMCAVSGDSKSSVNAVIEEKTEGTIGLSSQKLADNAAHLVKNEYEKIYDETKLEQKEIQIGEKSYYGYDVMCEYEKMPLYQRAFIIDTENHVTTVTITATTHAELDIILKSFYNI